MTQTIGLNASGIGIELNAAPLDLDSVHDFAGFNVLRGVPVRDWAIDSSGNAYFQLGGAPASDAAAFGLDPLTGGLFLVKEA